MSVQHCKCCGRFVQWEHYVSPLAYQRGVRPICAHCREWKNPAYLSAYDCYVRGYQWPGASRFGQVIDPPS